MSFDLAEVKLPARIYRRLLLLTEMWPGERAAPGSLLIKFHSGGSLAPFFWAGEPTFLGDFRDTLGQDRSIYCMSGLYGVLSSSAENIQALARYYVNEILSVQPQGPYLIGGWCDASLVSYEVAKLLLAQGHEVRSLILLDRDVSDQDFALRLARRLYRMFEAFDDRREQIKQTPLLSIKEILVNKRDQFLKLVISFCRKLDTSKAASPETTPDYVLTSYSGDVQLIIVRWGLLGFYRFEYFQRYWKKKVLGQLNIQTIAGKVHRFPDWLTVANLIKDNFKQIGV